MRSLPMLLRATRRSGTRGLVVLAVLIGLAGGSVLTGIQAARRTDSAFDRLLAETRSWDLLVNPDSGTESALELADVAALPGVRQAGRMDGVLLASRQLTDLAELDEGPTTLTSDGVAAYEFGRPLLTEGRMPSPDAGNEVFVSTAAAEDLGLEVGDTYEAKLLGFEDFGLLESAESPEAILEAYHDPGTGDPLDLDVVGIGPQFDEVVVDEGFGGGTMVLSPGFYDAHPEAVSIYWAAMVRLEPDADIEQFQSDVEALVPDEPIAFQARTSIEEQFERAVDPQVTALQVFTAVAAMVALVIVGQAIARRLQHDAADLRALSSLGVTLGQRAALGVTRIGLAAVAGALLAVGIAVVASPVAPVGVARQAEPDLGIRVDLPVLLLGGLGVAVVFTLVAVVPAFVAFRSSRVERTRTGVAARFAALGLAPTPAAGLRFAFDRGRTGAPTRSTLVGTVTGVALVAATLAFSSSLRHLVDTPSLYGTSWNANLTLEGRDDAQPEDFEALTASLDDRGDVEAYGLLYPGRIRVDGTTVPAVSIEPSDEPIEPTVLDGRAPVGDDEVAFGARTLDDLGLDVGDTVGVARGDRSGELTVVGSVVLPAIGAYSGSDKTTLGEGALASREALRSWGPEFDPYGVVVRTTGGVTGSQLADEIELPPPVYVSGFEPSVPSDVQSLDQVRSTPLALTALLGGLIALTVIHALGAAVRARRRELAVLRTLGLTRRQVLSAVAVQAACIALVGVVVGVPLGVAAGRMAWTTLAERRGAAIEVVTPALQLGGFAALVVALALLVGLAPGLRAARAHPATILRTE